MDELYRLYSLCDQINFILINIQLLVLLFLASFALGSFELNKFCVLFRDFYWVIQESKPALCSWSFGIVGHSSDVIVATSRDS